MYGAKLVKRTAMQQVIAHLWKKRTECEVCIVDTVDVTKLREWLRKKRRETGKNYTLFHAFLTIALRLLNERSGMNRFVQDCALYEREEQTVSFVIKRQYRDDAEEALITLTGTPDDTIDTVFARTDPVIQEEKSKERALDGVEDLMEKLTHMPFFLKKPFASFVLFLDRKGLCPKAFIKDNPYYSSVIISNLGSIGCKAIYHHLSNFGTNSLVMTIGTLHKEEHILASGEKVLRDVVDFSIITDERIVDGFYFVKSLKLIKKLANHPEILDRPLSEPSNL